MKPYKIVLNYETEIEAESEEEALNDFYLNEVNDSNSDLESFVSDNLTIETI